MGINPEPPELGDSCPLCFGDNETPEHVWCSVRAMAYGIFWTPPFGRVPNGVFKLNLDSDCIWIYDVGGIVIRLQWLPDYSSLRISKSGTGTVFFTEHLQQCKTFFLNELVDPFAVFYRGRASIAWTAPEYGPSIIRVAKSLNLDLSPGNTKAEFFPVEDGVNTYRFASKKPGTNINIKFDYS